MLSFLVYTKNVPKRLSNWQNAFFNWQNAHIWQKWHKKMKTADKSLEPKIRYLFLISEDCEYLSKTTRFRKESLWCSRKRRNPLTPWCDLRQYAKDHEDLRLPKIKFEGHHVCIIACIYVQYVLSYSLNPFCRDRNMLEYKSFDYACAFKSKALHVCIRFEVRRWKK